MLRAVSLFFLVSSTVAKLVEYTPRCGSKEDTTFTKTEGDVEGRYTVEWCSQLPENATVWNLELQYTANNACQPNIEYMKRRSFPTKMHSPVQTNITKRPPCNITCLSLPLDMVFSSCYVIRNDIAGKFKHMPVYTFHRIDNKFHSFEAINDLQPVNVVEKEGHELVVTYNLHYIRVDVFDMRLKEYKENSTEKEINEIDWVDIRNNCTEEKVQVVCHVTSPPSRYCVTFSLEFHAPWRNSFQNRKDFIYCSLPSDEVEMDLGTDARVWWAVGALALTLTLLAACWAVHTRVLADVRKRVLHQWVNRYAAYTADHAPAAAEDPGHILLLYARDCEPAMQAVSVLKEMLEEGAPGRVYDLFSESCMALYAQAPEEWLCGVLSRPDVRVVLVQTPAAAALYAAQVSHDNLQMQQPLLGARVQYKKPHYGDVLLQFALRLVRDMAPMQQEYARYYIATVSELEHELMPAVSPYRRYVLPAHAARLLADLRLRTRAAAAAPPSPPSPPSPPAPPSPPSPPSPPPPRLRALAAAIDELHTYVQHNENYLRDELIFI